MTFKKICRLAEEELHLRKSYMRIKGWFENFAVNLRKEEVYLLVGNH